MVSPTGESRRRTTSSREVPERHGAGPARRVLREQRRVPPSGRQVQVPRPRQPAPAEVDRPGRTALREVQLEVQPRRARSGRAPRDGRRRGDLHGERRRPRRARDRQRRERLLGGLARVGPDRHQARGVHPRRRLPRRPDERVLAAVEAGRDRGRADVERHRRAGREPEADRRLVAEAVGRAGVERRDGRARTDRRRLGLVRLEAVGGRLPDGVAGARCELAEERDDVVMVVPRRLATS